MPITRLTTAEAMEYIGCKETKFHCLVKSGHLDGTYFNIGRRRIFMADKLDEWMLSGGERRFEEDKPGHGQYRIV